MGEREPFQPAKKEDPEVLREEKHRRVRNYLEHSEHLPENMRAELTYAWDTLSEGQKLQQAVSPHPWGSLEWNLISDERLMECPEGIVLREGDHMVGMGLLAAGSEGIVELRRYVLPQYRGKGIGLNLLMLMLDVCDVAGYKNIHIYPTTPGAQKTIERLPEKYRSMITEYRVSLIDYKKQDEEIEKRIAKRAEGKKE